MLHQNPFRRPDILSMIRVLFHKLIVVQLVKNFSACSRHEARSITVLTKPLHWSLSWA